MLVLTRKCNREHMIGDDVEASVLAMMGEKMRSGIQAPRDIPVFRKEVYIENLEEGADGSKERVTRLMPRFAVLAAPGGRGPPKALP